MTSAAGPTPDRAPEYESFNRVIATLERMDAENLHQVGMAVAEDGDAAFRIRIDPAAKQRPDVRQLLKDLRLDPQAESYRVVYGQRGGGDTIAVILRPLMGAMYYLCQGVDVPRRDVDNGVVTITRDENGEPFDWQMAMKGMIHIRSQVVKPLDAFVSVRFRDYYFYIASNDVESKETFSLLFLLFTLQGGEKPSKQPLLSLPIGF